MPNYALICSRCGNKLPEEVMTIAERERMFCNKMDCGGELTNDYARHQSSNFQLKGGDWPGKMNALETKILKERNID